MECTATLALLCMLRCACCAAHQGALVKKSLSCAHTDTPALLCLPCAVSAVQRIKGRFVKKSDLEAYLVQLGSGAGAGDCGVAAAAGAGGGL